MRKPLHPWAVLALAVVLPGVKDVAVKAESEEAVKPEAAAPGSAAAAAQGPVGAPSGS